jgi:hypothetical protein
MSKAEDRARLTELAAAQLIRVPDDRRAAIVPTDAGRRLNADIRAATTDVTRRLWGDLPGDDLATAGRVLSTVLTRANEELANEYACAARVDPRAPRQRATPPLACNRLHDPR